MTDTTLADLFDDAALLSLEHRLHFGEVVGESDWHVDLAVPRFEFTGRQPLTCERVHLLGSAAPGPQSWMWAWATPGAFPDDAVRVAGNIRDHGKRLGIRELAEPEVPFNVLQQAQGNPAMIALLLTEAAKALSGHWMSFIGHVGQGTHVALLIKHPSFELGRPTPERTLRVIQQGVVEPSVSNPRRAVTSYARWRGLDQKAAGEGEGLLLTGAGFDLTVTFDGQDQVSAINLASDAVSPASQPCPDS
ncbi:hypothetical protein DFP74_6078 [Nocardiopsis sp. Huas11]|uniref:DUF6882 domain-containing protein n=1 Tax=Nocardiopsis sp. Huas11 TaxID=2183912 RepID=UPI000EB5137C|nr:DUF6882 domain-containing protein [Nocardiopsis sp. Huas11]RKS10315.1 hypothetical protein DFP74_6078 [Nocardiopsis sp. Huas11]